MSSVPSPPSPRSLFPPLQHLYKQNDLQQRGCCPTHAPLATHPRASPVVSPVPSLPPSDQYLDKQNFLKDVELREYEKERDRRLASDVRNRGRL